MAKGGVTDFFANSDICGLSGISDNPDQIVSMTAKWNEPGKTVFLGKSEECTHWVAEVDIHDELTYTCNFGPNQEEATRDYLDRAFGVNI